ncbi:hypothetical protein GJ496_003079 [Pomphorhynchus laevis]|nr:hypothetical protein GJ496_003079 [Pomphorhynchus laevis]
MSCPIYSLIYCHDKCASSQRFDNVVDDLLFEQGVVNGKLVDMSQERYDPCVGDDQQIRNDNDGVSSLTFGFGGSGDDNESYQSSFCGGNNGETNPKSDDVGATNTTLNNNDSNNKKGERYVVKLRGLPWSATKEEVVSFMSGCNIKNGTDGILMVSRHGPVRGEAFVELESENDLEVAMSKHRDHMGTRYIEVFRSSAGEMNHVLNPKVVANWRDPVVRLRGIPYYCTKDDIYDFFSGLQIAHNGVYMSMDETGNASGLAFVAFTKMDIAFKALEKHRMMIGHRYVEVFQSSYSEARAKMLDDIELSGRIPFVSKNVDRYPRDVRTDLSSDFRIDIRDARSGGLREELRGDFRGGDIRDFRGDFRNLLEDLRGDLPRSVRRDVRGDFRADMERDFRGSELRGEARSNLRYDIPSNFRSNFDSFAPPHSRTDRSKYDYKSGLTNTAGNPHIDNVGGGGHYPLSNSARRQNSFNNNFAAPPSNNILMQGLPFSCSDMDIIEFFKPMRPVSVRLKYDSRSRPSGEAVVEFSSHEQALEAMKYDKQYIGSRYVDLTLETGNTSTSRRNESFNDNNFGYSGGRLK